MFSQIFRSILISAILTLLLSTSCNFVKDKKDIQTTSDDNIVTGKLELRHARGFEITYEGPFKIITISRLGEDYGKSAEYLLAPRNLEIPEKFADHVPIRIPLNKVVCLSVSPHLAFTTALNVNSSIVGIADPDYSCNPQINNLISTGNIQVIGQNEVYDYEKIVKISPDVAFGYVFGNNTAKAYQRLSELGVKIVSNSGYLENTALGQAEWIKFMAAFYNKESLADSIFDHIEREYVSTRNLASSVSAKPAVFWGVSWNGTWTVPTKENLSTRFLTDAGAEYLWSDAGDFKLNLDFESVFQKAHNADYWFAPGQFTSLDGLKSKDEKYTLFKAFQQGNVYNYHGRVNDQGWFDYWESGIINPHLILKDMVKIFHPELLPEYELYYYKKLEPNS